MADGDRTGVENSTGRSVLTISEVLPEDVGSYTLFVRTRQGIAHCTIVLSINGAKADPNLFTSATVDIFTLSSSQVGPFWFCVFF